MEVGSRLSAEPTYQPGYDQAGFMARGRAYAAKGQYDQAISEFSGVIALYPSADAFWSRAHAYAKIDDGKHAALDVMAAIQADPRNKRTD